MTVVQEETGCYVYGAVPPGTQLDGLLGLDDVQVRVVESEGVGLVLSTIALDRPPGRRAELLAHSRVVDALAATGAVVPVRFGTITLDEVDAVEEVLGDPGLPRLLERLTEVVQLNLRATYDEAVVLAEVVRDDPVVADLRRRTRDLPEGAMHPDLVRLGERVSRALDAIRAADGQDLTSRVEPLAVALRPRPVGGTDGLLDVALLVERQHHEQVEQHLEDLAEELHPRVRLRLVGPVPPYDFVEDRSWV